MKKLNIALSKREKIIVSAAGVFLGVFILLQLIIFPVFSSKDKLRRSIETDRKRLTEMVRLGEEYKALQGNSGGIGNALTQRGGGFTLFSLLEKMASQAGLKDRIKYIKPSSAQTKGNYKISSVEMQFEAITMKELFDYLYRVEDPKHIITVKRLSIKKHKDKEGYVDATLQVSTMQLA